MTVGESGTYVNQRKGEIYKAGRNQTAYQQYDFSWDWYISSDISSRLSVNLQHL